MEREPFEYSPIVERPQLRLPGGARVAVWFGVNVEHYPFGRPAISLAPFTAELVPDPLNWGWRDYGPRVGVWRLSELFARQGVRPTAIMNAEVLTRYPQIVEHGVEQGWGFVAHGNDNASWWVGMDSETEAAAIAEIAASFQRATGARPRGWLGPALTATPQTADVLAEAGFDYTLDWANDDQPYPMRVRSGSLLSLPYSSEVNDIPAFVLHHHTADQFAQTVMDQFDQLYAEGEQRVRVLGIGLHPFLAGQAFRARHLERAVEHIAGHDRVWLATSDEIASWYTEATSSESSDRNHPERTS